MKTVGDYKKAGLAFVDGDVMMDQPLSSGGADLLNTSDSWDIDDTIEHFEWRTNTGVKPEFNGVIELEHRGGTQKYVEPIGDYYSRDWSLEQDDGDITRWRPHIDKRESPYDVGAHCSDASKPVYTQAMADSGELPPVGSECLLHLAFVTYRAEVTYIGSGVGCFKRLPDGKEFSFSVCDTSFKPIQTEREKAIDKAALLIASKDVLHNQYPEALIIAGMLYDAGYRLTTTPKQG